MSQRIFSIAKNYSSLILKSDLHHDTPGLPLRYNFLLFEMKVQVVAVAVFQNGAEAVGVDLEHVVQLNDARVLQRLGERGEICQYSIAIIFT